MVLELRCKLERQKKAAVIVEEEVSGLGTCIGGAWWEGFDLGNTGAVRHSHVKHAVLMSELVDVVKAIQAAITSEDFGESHKQITNYECNRKSQHERR